MDIRSTISTEPGRYNPLVQALKPIYTSLKYLAFEGSCHPMWILFLEIFLVGLAHTSKGTATAAIILSHCTSLISLNFTGKVTNLLSFPIIHVLSLGKCTIATTWVILQNLEERNLTSLTLQRILLLSYHEYNTHLMQILI